MKILQDFAYSAPESAAEAAELVLAGGTVLAGGSDILPQLKTAVIRPDRLVDLGRIPSMREIRLDEEGLHIGAMATLSQLAKSPVVAENVRAIGQAARNTASPQIRSRGTLAGNLLQARRCLYYNQTEEWRDGMPACYKVGGDVCLQIPKADHCRAIYYSDLATACLLYDAKVKVYTGDGGGWNRLDEVIELHTSDRRPPMLLEEILIPARQLGEYSVFQKHSLRGSIDFPVINFAVRGEDGGCRLLAGAVGCHVVRLSGTEEWIRQQGEGFDVSEAAEIAVQELQKHSGLIREVGISVKVKRQTFQLVDEILARFKRRV